MADETRKETVTLQELMVSNLAMTDAPLKLLIQKGVFTDEEFKGRLATERAIRGRAEARALKSTKTVSF